MRPLEDVCVLDFSTLLPGPFATLMLADAGARVIEIERPGIGDEVRPLAYWGLGNGFAQGLWPEANDALVTGASPRYQIYGTADGRHLAVAALEDRFWNNFCRLIGLPEALADSDADPEVVRSAVAAKVSERSAEAWRAIYSGFDVCCSVVPSLREAVVDPHVASRGVLDRKVLVEGRPVAALPRLVARTFGGKSAASAPSLGPQTEVLLGQEAVRCGSIGSYGQ
ncbi:CoA transferase [Bradyrhizobium elkanii]|uniref:CoA transferase n=1 Tax=Bradyrhizobium elkanii TaxID=29448 RepID=UPI0004AD2C86|nr:CoA transferase [Bradyrhizobium elkanii]